MNNGNVNFVQEHRLFANWLRINEFTPTAIAVWYALFMIMNEKGFPNGFVSIPTQSICVYAHCSEDSFARARVILINSGLINYEKGNRKKAARYQMNYLSNNNYYYPQITDNNTGNNTGKTTGNNKGKSTDKTTDSLDIYKLNKKETKQHTFNITTTKDSVRAYDSAWKTSGKVRAVVAQNIINQYEGKIDDCEAHERICYLMAGSRGAAFSPNTINEGLKRYESLNEGLEFLEMEQMAQGVSKNELELISARVEKAPNHLKTNLKYKLLSDANRALGG